MSENRNPRVQLADYQDNQDAFNAKVQTVIVLREEKGQDTTKTTSAAEIQTQTDVRTELLQLQMSAARDKELIRTLTEEARASKAEREGIKEQLKVRDEQILVLQKAKDQVQDQLEAAETSRRRSLGLARERLEQWKETKQQKQLQLEIPLDQSVPSETELKVRDEQIRALQKESTDLKVQLDAVETSRRCSLGLARERLEQWKEVQRQKQLQSPKPLCQIPLVQPVHSETEAETDLKVRDEQSLVLQKAKDRVQDQLEAAETSRRRSLRLARERLEQWKVSQTQKQLQLKKSCQISLDQSVLSETEVNVRDEQIRALQKEVTEVKVQLDAVETSRRCSLRLARERLEQWKVSQRQKELQLSKPFCQIPLDQSVLSETELKVKDEQIRALQKEVTEVKVQLDAAETSRRCSLGLARARLEQWKVYQRQMQQQLSNTDCQLQTLTQVNQSMTSDNQTETGPQVPLVQPVHSETEAETELNVGDEQIFVLQKAKDQVQDQLEAAETSRRRSLRLARERLEQWKETQRQKQLQLKKSRQIPLDQSVQSETELNVRDEQIRALQKEVTKVKVQLDEAETSRRCSLRLARERLEQWKETQRQKKLQNLSEVNESMTSDNQTETGPQVPLDQPVHLEIEGEMETAIEEGFVQLLKSTIQALFSTFKVKWELFQATETI